MEPAPSLILDHLPDGVALVDVVLDGLTGGTVTNQAVTIRWANGRFCSWCDQSSLPGRTFFEALGNPEVLGPDLHPFETALATGRAASTTLRTRDNRYLHLLAMPLAAAPLGYFAGLVGIGGGILLSPLLHLARWHKARGIAATASLFILVNSLFGLAGQMVKNGPGLFGQALGAALPLLVAVLIGGQIGSLLAARLLPPQWIRWLTATLVLVVGVRLLIGV